MKKMLLGCFFAVFMCTGLFADTAQDEMFEKVVNGMRENGKDVNVTISADKARRIVYLAAPIDVEKSLFTNEKMVQLKKQLITSVKNKPNSVKLFKTLKLRVVTTYITSDNDIFTISYSYKDL